MLSLYIRGFLALKALPALTAEQQAAGGRFVTLAKSVLAMFTAYAGVLDLPTIQREQLCAMVTEVTQIDELQV